MKATLTHVGIAVRDLDEALRFYRDALGLEVSLPETVSSQQVRTHMVSAGEAELEFLEATEDDSPVGRFLVSRGPGLHHITFRVDNLNDTLEQLRVRGVRLIDEAPRQGQDGSLVAFIHPSSVHGVLVELMEGPQIR